MNSGLFINDELLNWDPVGNIQDAGASFIGVIALVVLYLLFNKKIKGADIDLRLTKEISIDRDCWVVEIEDKNGFNPFHNLDG